MKRELDKASLFDCFFHDLYCFSAIEIRLKDKADKFAYEIR